MTQGPVAGDYNGPPSVTRGSPMFGVTISDCNLDHPVCVVPASSTVRGPMFVVNTNGITLKNEVATYNSVRTG